MLALVVALAATMVLTQPALAQQTYTVWSSVVLTRTGERTPATLGNLPTELTSTGAQQAYEAGAFLRNRYITGNDSSNGGVGEIIGLNKYIISNLELYVSTLDTQYTAATAQAFIQGLYPPASSESAEAIIDETSRLANDIYVQNPMSGYQYAQIQTAGRLDFNFLYLSANFYCPAFDMAAEDYQSTQEFAGTLASSKSMYTAIGDAWLWDVLPYEETWNYDNAYVIYDYLNYLNVHNASVANYLSENKDSVTNATYLDKLRWLADEQQYAQLGNLSAINNVSHTALPGGVLGSISTIAGNMLAAKVLGQLQRAIQYQGEFFKLNLLFSDYAPFTSFFALARLPRINSNFRGLPDFASVAAFELFSYTNSSTSLDFPDASDLWVRFYFRNGTDDGDTYQSYPVFGRGPDSTDMTWSEFEASMYAIALSDPGDWCLQCGAEELFCAAWNASDGATAAVSGPDASTSASSKASTMDATIAGVIGAMVTLAVAVLLFIVAILLGCVRLQPVRFRKQNAEGGGFKGGQKMASDQDLTIPKSKSGAVVESTMEHDGPMSPVAGGHERVGSWELKEAEEGRQRDAQALRVLSFETERGVDPFMDPVKAKETV